MQERRFDILKKLYSSNEFVTTRFLAENMSCSLKTVRNDLKQLGDFLQEHKLGLIVSKSNKGVYLIKYTEWEEAEAEWNSENGSELNSSDNQLKILEILLKQSSIQKKKLEEKLLISRLDAQRQINLASNWLEDRDISVNCRRGIGIKIDFNEYDWRIAMWDLFREITREKQVFTSQAIKFHIEKYLWGFDIEGVVRAIGALEKKFGFNYNFDGYQQLLFLLSICVIRLRKKEVVDLPIDLAYEGKVIDETIADACETDLKSYYQITFPKNEKQFILLVISITEIRDFCNENFKKNYFNVNKKICRTVERVISIIGNILGQDIEKDETLYDCLFLYIKVSVLKLQYGLKEINPLTDLVKIRYPNIYAAAWSASLVIESDLEVRIGDHEVSFLALYIGGAIERLNVEIRVCILCNYGIGISRILKEQIERSIQNIKVIDVFTTRDLFEIQKSYCDFLISSVPVGDNFAGKQVVQIGNVLQHSDIQFIQKEMKQIRKKRLQGISSKPVEEEYNLFREELVYSFGAGSNKENLISFLCKKLEEAGYVARGYEPTVLDREQTTSTIIDHGVAIPHGAASLVIIPVIAVAVLKEPVDWGNGKMVDRIFLLALNLDKSFQSKSKIISFYSSIVTLLEENSAYDNFHNLNNKKEITQYLNNITKGDGR